MKAIATSRSASKIVVLGNPGNWRIDYFQAAMKRLGRAPADVISWERVLREGMPALGDDTILRIESPGENFEVEKLLLALGEREPDETCDSPRISPAGLVEDRGRILHPRQYYLGFRAALRRIHARTMNAPSDIEIMWDKPRCHAHLADLPEPPALKNVRSFDEITWRRVFIKLANGSSASGVIAYETDGRRHQAFTTIEKDGGKLYNSKRIRRYTRLSEIAEIVDAICREGAHVERWIPKAGFNGRTFDLRILVVAGRATHVVARGSRFPITNLHLDNVREDVGAIRARLDWDRVIDTAERAVRAFPDSLYAGVDLLVASDWKRFYIAEVNAFGDLLLGENTYDAEIRAVLGD